ncbi:MAG: esterase [Eubacterium sp.]|jgi:predicted alpha/beta superfamily hydrolase|nr:esterase [Eubacterium sp.]MCH4045865.1 esterase [Eubacterium sp.]MCH4078958.1 esterase [Eubacterium sp.]
MDIFEYGNKDAELVLIQMVDDHDLEIIENEVKLVRNYTGADFRLIACRVDDWNNDLSPWEAPAVFGKQGFGGGAKDTLTKVMTFCEDKSKTYYIGGYSLAGLFALWAACQKDVFQGAAAASPSVWFPGFTDYLNEQGMKSENVYLSLGDREEKARNPVMATVGDRIREAYELLKKQNINCILEWNEGNHFKDADLRTAKAFSWVMKQKA